MVGTKTPILDHSVDPVNLDSSEFCVSMQKGKGESDSNCWTSPSGAGFEIRGKMYLKDSAKFIAVDWFTLETPRSKVALHPKCLVQILANFVVRCKKGRARVIPIVGHLQVVLDLRFAERHT
ncbi:hypothetical protein Hdeb2414_s0004g00137151 [Helianthus debilis subsp. tardiflorus]